MLVLAPTRELVISSWLCCLLLLFSLLLLLLLLLLLYLYLMELQAIQIETECNKFAASSRLVAVCLYGGAPKVCCCIHTMNASRVILTTASLNSLTIGLPLWKGTTNRQVYAGRAHHNCNARTTERPSGYFFIFPRRDNLLGLCVLRLLRFSTIVFSFCVRLFCCVFVLVFFFFN
jgi:hypothetical protein